MTDNILKCDICHKTFTQKVAIRIHKESVHLRLKKYQCDICLKTFYEKKKHINHVEQVHQGKKIFKCDDCPLRFSQRGNLNTHVNRYHTNISRDFSCEFCDYKSYTLDVLKKGQYPTLITLIMVTSNFIG